MRSEKASILIVDDLPDKLLVLETVLADLEENIVTARSGEEALQCVLRQEFAVILMDVEMPGMDGIEAATYIRQRRKSARTPIIFVTAYADDLRTTQGYSLGAVDYMLSPVVPEVLRTKVKVFVDLFRMRQEVRRHAEERIELAREQAAREEAERSAAALRASEERFRLASEAVSGFIYEVDVRNGRFVPSPGIHELLGFAPEEADSLAWWHGRVHSDDLPILVPAPEIADHTSRHTYRHQYRVQHRDGNYLHVWDQGLVVLDESKQPARLVGNVVDITEQKIAEQALAESNRRKDEFLSMLAHELRNPLAPIRNAVALLRLQDVQYPNLRPIRDLIERNVSQLVRLVDDLLDVSRITHGKIRVHMEPLDVRKAVTQAVEIAMPHISTRAHRLHVSTPDAPLFVAGDLTRLTQIVANLLNNAAKYTEDGGQVWLTVSTDGDDAAIRVRDTGVGLAPDMVERIFEPFIQVERSLERSEGGLGIGLTLARRLVELHGGQLSAYSDGPGCGSEFIIRLPARPELQFSSADQLAGMTNNGNGVSASHIAPVAANSLPN